MNQDDTLAVEPGGRPLHLLLGLMGAWYLAFLIYGPQSVIQHDELNFVVEALRIPAEGRLASYGHGPFMYELVVLVETAFLAVLWALGKIGSRLDFLVHMQMNMPLHLRLCRAITAVGALATIYQLYRVASLFGGRRVGLISALLTAVNLSFIALTSILKEEVISWLFVLLSMEFAWRCARTGRIRDAILGGASAGLAFSTKYLAVFAPVLALLPLMAFWGKSKRNAISLGSAFSIACLVTVLLTFPFLISDFNEVLNSVMGTNARYEGITDKFALWAYVWHHIPNIVGWPIFILGAAEFLRRVVLDPRGPIILMVVPILQFMFIAVRRGYSMAHYAVFPALFLIILFASVFVIAWDSGRNQSWKRASLALLLITLTCAFPSLSGSAKYAMLLLGPQTPNRANALIETHASPGDCVIVNQGLVGDNTYGPPLRPRSAPPGTGLFTRAREIAVQKMPDPKFDLRVTGADQVSADFARGCEWLVVGRRGQESFIEYGMPPANAPEFPAPPGYTLVGSVDAFPEPHSIFYPYLTTLDYDDLRRVSFSDLRSRGAMGLSFSIFRYDSLPPKRLFHKPS